MHSVHIMAFIISLAGIMSHAQIQSTHCVAKGIDYECMVPTTNMDHEYIALVRTLYIMHGIHAYNRSVALDS